MTECLFPVVLSKEAVNGVAGKLTRMIENAWARGAIGQVAGETCGRYAARAGMMKYTTEWPG